MFAWLKKLFASNKTETAAPAATPANPGEAPAETMTGAADTTEEASSEDMK